MSDGLQHIPTELEKAADQPVPAADQLAGRFPKQPHPGLADEATHSRIMHELKFGLEFTDYMAKMVWRKGEGWVEKALVPFQNLSLSPAAAVLHYGQEIFEGLKAYRHSDGSVWTFRPGYNAARMNASAKRLALPEIPTEDFVGSLVDLVRADQRWVPSEPGSSLYLRPFMFASEAFLGVHSAKEVTFLTIASPVGPYFKDGFAPVSIWVSADYHRAGPGGTGAAKTAGNYASSLLPQDEAAEKGYQQVCFLDAKENTYLEELGGMNVFVVYQDGSVATPALTGTILEGNTRSAICKMLRSSGTPVFEKRLALEQVVADIQNGNITEMFACGTAAVVTPIGKLGGEGFQVELPAGPVTQHIYKSLTDIQNGISEDPFGWTYRIC